MCLHTNGGVHIDMTFIVSLLDDSTYIALRDLVFCGLCVLYLLYMYSWDLVVGVLPIYKRYQIMGQNTKQSFYAYLHWNSVFRHGSFFILKFTQI